MCVCVCVCVWVGGWEKDLSDHVINIEAIHRFMYTPALGGDENDT